LSNACTFVVIFASPEHPPESHFPCATAAALAVASAIANGNPNLNFELVISLFLIRRAGVPPGQEQCDILRICAYCGRCAQHFIRNRHVSLRLAPLCRYFDVKAKDGQIILTPVRIQRADAVRAKLAELNLTDADVEEAVSWARSSRGTLG
jgi:hypothetical protein